MDELEPRDYSEYVTTGGVRLKLRPIPHRLLNGVRNKIKAEYAARGESLEPPTYSFETVPGTMQTAPLDEKCLDVEGDATATQENHRRWDAYQQTLRRFADEIEDRSTAIMLGLGVELVDPMPESLREDREWAGLPVPENPRDLKVVYLAEHVLSDGDMNAIMIAMNMLNMRAMVTAEDLDKVEESFRGALRRLSRSLTTAVTDSDEQVEPQPAADGD
jgi:hypothetical protein